jgi:hypothetical protein
MGIIGGVPSSGFHQNTQPGYPQTTQSPHMAPETLTQPPTQSQWSYPQEKPPQTSLHQQDQSEPSPSMQHDQQQPPWPHMSPVSSYGQGHISPASVSPPHQHVQPQIPPNKPTQTQSPMPTSQHVVSPPNKFTAELPGNMGDLKQIEATQASQYQAYHPPGAAQAGSSSPAFAIPRRAVSTSTMPLADPWRFVDFVTELPTREFYILADLLFDALDRKFEPRNTGLLEGPKILGSWIELTRDAHGKHDQCCQLLQANVTLALFSYNDYTALAGMWSLEGIPHVMVPVQPGLAPTWNSFSPHSHAQDLRVIAEPPTPLSTYATYMPALTRSGWYKFFFLEMMHGPDNIDKLMPALCEDTYKPGVLNQPDVKKRDKSEVSTLQARAAEVQTIAIKRVCDETRAAMALEPNLAVLGGAAGGYESLA